MCSGHQKLFRKFTFTSVYYLLIWMEIQSVTCCNIDRPNLCFTVNEHAIVDIPLSIILWSLFCLSSIDFVSHKLMVA